MNRGQLIANLAGLRAAGPKWPVTANAHEQAILVAFDDLVGEVERLRRENERPLWMLAALLRAAGGELSCSTADMQEVGSRDEIVRIDGEGTVTYRLVAATHV